MNGLAGRLSDFVHGLDLLVNAKPEHMDAAPGTPGPVNENCERLNDFVQGLDPKHKRWVDPERFVDGSVHGLDLLVNVWTAVTPAKGGMKNAWQRWHLRQAGKEQ